jgi:hypothetical protein
MSGDFVSWRMKSWHVPLKFPGQRAVRAVAEPVAQGDYPSQFEAIRTIAKKSGIGSPETLCKRVRQAQATRAWAAGGLAEECQCENYACTSSSPWSKSSGIDEFSLQVAHKRRAPASR